MFITKIRFLPSPISTICSSRLLIWSCLHLTCQGKESQGLPRKLLKSGLEIAYITFIHIPLENMLLFFLCTQAAIISLHTADLFTYPKLETSYSVKGRGISRSNVCLPLMVLLFTFHLLALRNLLYLMPEDY